MTKLLTAVLMLLSFVTVFSQSQGSMRVKVFFHNEKLNPNQLDCSKVFATTRTIPKTKAVARAALDELFKGTTADERSREFSSYPASM